MKEHQSFDRELKSRLEILAQEDKRIGDILQAQEWYFEDHPDEERAFILYQKDDKYYLRGFEIEMLPHYRVTMLVELDNPGFSSDKVRGGGRWKIDQHTKTLYVVGKSTDYGPVKKEQAVKDLAEPLKGLLGVDQIKFDLIK